MLNVAPFIILIPTIGTLIWSSSGTQFNEVARKFQSFPGKICVCWFVADNFWIAIRADKGKNDRMTAPLLWNENQVSSMKYKIAVLNIENNFHPRLDLKMLCIV